MKIFISVEHLRALRSFLKHLSDHLCALHSFLKHLSDHLRALHSFLKHLSDHVVQNSPMLEVNKLHLCVKTCLDFKARLACDLFKCGEGGGRGDERSETVPSNTRVYVCIHVCVVYTCVCMCVCSVFTRVCTCMCTCVCTCVYMCVYMCVYTCVCMCVYVCVCCVMMKGMQVQVTREPNPWSSLLCTPGDLTPSPHCSVLQGT